MRGIIVILVGLIAGVAISGTTASIIKYTNKPEFCISCHEMEVATYDEYRRSKHFQNASGVQTSCSDCHVDKSSWPAMMYDKTRKGVYDIYQHLRGSIDTPEKYQARKAQLVERVFEDMRANDSAACRHCHDWNTVNLKLQEGRAINAHEKARPEETCVDCHKGVAHESNKPTPEEEGGFEL